MSKQKEQKKPPLDFKNPYHIWGMILPIVGVTFGRLLGGLIGAIAGIAIIRITDLDLTKEKKISICVFITIGAIFFYIILLALAKLILQQ